MKVIILFVLIVSSAPVYELRGMYKKEKIRVLESNIQMDFRRIALDIMSQAKKGETESQFTLKCEYQRNGMGLCVKTRNQLLFVSSEKMVKNNLTLYTNKIVERLKTTFPDSTITKLAQCCEYHIDWYNKFQEHP